MNLLENFFEKFFKWLWLTVPITIPFAIVVSTLIIEKDPSVSELDVEVIPAEIADSNYSSSSPQEREAYLKNDLKQQQYTNARVIGYTIDGCEGEIGTLFSASKGEEKTLVTVLICDDGTRHEIPLGIND